MNKQLQDALQMPLKELNSVAFDHYSVMLAFIKHHATPDFVHIDGEVSPFEYLTNRFMEVVLENQKKYGDVVWEFNLISLYFRSGSKLTFVLTADCMYQDRRINTSTHVLTMNEEFKFGMLLVPFFNSGFADHYAKDLTSNVADNKH
jgi:hypothetical protein